MSIETDIVKARPRSASAPSRSPVPTSPASPTSPAAPRHASAPEKYHSAARYHLAKLKRAACRRVLSPLLRWSPLHDAAPGYTVLIGAPARLARLLEANLQLLTRQRFAHLHEILIVLDESTDAAGRTLPAALPRRFPDLPLRVVVHRPAQRRTLRMLNWAWANAWFNWALGIAHTQTQFAVLHDLDAMLLTPDMLETRFAAIQRSGDHVLGAHWYTGNGLVERDQLAMTFEMSFDARHIRQQFKPIDLFNRVRRFAGRRVEFDTFLDVQTRGLKRSVLTATRDDLVHPGQLICQYHALRRGSEYVAPARNNLPMLPYLFHLGGDDAALTEQSRAFEQAATDCVPLLGMPMNTGRMSADHQRWLTGEVTRLEMQMTGDVRPAARRYIDSIHHYLQRTRLERRGS